MTKQGTLEAKHLESMKASEQAESSSCRDSKVTCEDLALKNCSSGNIVVPSKLSADNLQTAQSRWNDPLEGRLSGSVSYTRDHDSVGCSSKSELDRVSPDNQGSGDTTSHGDVAGRFNSGERADTGKDVVCVTKSELVGGNSPKNNCNEAEETGSQVESTDVLLSSSFTRTKMLGKSGNTQYFVKDTLKDKGTLCRGIAPSGEFQGSYPEASSPNKVDTSAPALNSNRGVDLQEEASTNQNVSRENNSPPPRVIPNSGTLINSNGESVVPPMHAITNQVTNSNGVAHSPPHSVFPNSSSETGVLNAVSSLFSNSISNALMLPHDGVSLREWLKFGENNRNKLKTLHIYKQILDAVSDLHSKGIVLLNLCPSYFKLLQSNEVTYIGSTVQIENFSDQGAQDKPNYQNEKRPMESSSNPNAKRNKLEENPKLAVSEPQSPNISGVAAANDSDVSSGGAQWNAICDEISNPKPVHVTESDSSSVQMSDSSKFVLASANNKSEEVKWYASPEEFNKRQCILPSNIYSLGILLVELLSAFDSERGRAVAMLNLRNSTLPPDFLAGNPSEAELCFRLLHAEPSLRPSIREILESDVIKDIEDLSNSSSSCNHDDTESELLLHFLDSLQQQKEDRSSKLMAEIKMLESDIEEVNKRRRKISFSPEDSVHARQEVSGESSSGVNCNKSLPVSNEERLVKNMDPLQKAYFSLRSTVDSSKNGPARSDVKEMCCCQRTLAKKDQELIKSTDDLGAFYNGLCKYARYTKFKVCATLRNENIYNTNIISSLSFDPNEDYFAVAGVSKKIKIYNFHAVLNETIDGQYPVIQMSNNSKLSCTCWSNYISNCLASSDYDGVVKLWDAETGKEVSRYTEHIARAWSVDFSQASPTKLASGSDDRRVKVWDTTQKNSVLTIGCIAPICCVQFASKSSHLLAFGGSNNSTYCMDLRNPKIPWRVLLGHAGAVSYVKFFDSDTLLSASTDSTLKIWDLNKRGICISTLGGHTNRKSFVGLSINDDGYIMCGSETNELFAYHRSFSMPITSHKFGVINPLTGEETNDNEGRFVSAVCSQRQSELVVAANSAGSIKVLQMV